MRRLVKLKDVCLDVTVGHVGSMADEYVNSGIPFLRSQNILPFRLDDANLKYISEDFHKRLKKSALSPGDVVVVRTGYPGTACVIPHRLPVSNCADLVVIRPSDEIDSHYLCCIFNSAWGRSTVSGSLVGVAQQHFNIGVAKEMAITLPTIGVQRRIASILSAYDDLIENNTRRIHILEQLAQSLYQEWFVNFRFPGHEKVRMVKSQLGPIPEGWRPTRLGDLCAEARRGVHPSEVDPDTPYIGLEHLPRKSVALGEWGRAGDVGSTKLHFKRGDILFGKIRPYFHKVGVAPVDGVASSDAIVIVPKDVTYFGTVLCCVSSDAFVRHASQTSQGTKMPRANWDVLVKCATPLPNGKLLERFNGVIEPTAEMLQNLILRNRNLRTTRDFLLPKLISGEIPIEATDEHAAELVEQIA